MKFTSFKELLLKKAEGDSSLQDLIKNTKDDFFSDRVIEALQKMAEDKRRPRSSNRAVQHFGDYSLDHAGDMGNMVHDALSHHASHYKAAVNSDQQNLAGQHMKKIHNIMHMSRKLASDGTQDHGDGKLKIDAVDPKPWERAGFPKEHEGKAKKFVTDTKGWSRNSGNFEYMQGNPHDHYAKETEGHGHKGAYPLEEMKVNGKHLHINDDVESKGFQGHEFDEHPIMKNGLYGKSPQSITDETYDQYLGDLENYESSDHMDKYYDRHESMEKEDPEGYASRGTNKPEKILRDKEAVAKQEDTEKEDKLKDIHSELTDEEINHPTNKKLFDAIQTGAFDGLDKDSILSIIRGSSDVKKSLTQIKDTLVKNMDFLKENPDLLIDIKERLIKASGDDDDAEKWLREHDDSFSESDYNAEDDGGGDYSSEDSDFDGGMGELFDDPDEADDDSFDDEDRHLVEGEKPEMVDINEEEKPSKSTEARVGEVDESVPKKEKRSSSYADWKPREDYTPEQQKKIDEHVADGYHAGDAEILARANKKHTTIKDAVQHRVHPHEMSDKMHDRLKGLADLHMNDIISGEYSVAEPELNPQKATAGTIKGYNDMMGDFRAKKEEFYNQDDVKNMSPRERNKAFKQWKEDYHKENPEHEKSLKQEWSSHGETAKENWDKRGKNLDEGRAAIAGAGQTDTEAIENLHGGSSQMAAGDEGQALTTQGAYQSAGFSTDDSGRVSGGTTIKDPYATFAEKNPELKTKYMDKLNNSLPDDAKARLKRINTHKDE